MYLLGGRPGQVSLYAARTLKSAKAILIPVMSELNARYGLGLTIRTVEGEIWEPNGAVIRLHGLKDNAAAELLRGQKFRRVVVDECGAFHDDLLKFAIQSILQPTLMDLRGEMLIAGTPGPIPKGLFYDLVGDPNGDGHSGRWASAGWDLKSNPHLAGTPEENLQEIIEANNWDLENPTLNREVFGKWVNDSGALIYHYRGERWATPPSDGKTVLVVDFAGSDKDNADDTAFLVGRQSPYSRPHVFLLEGFKCHGITIHGIAERIRQLQAKHNVGTVVVDAGALGAGYAITLRENFNIDCRAADKRDKRARIELAVATLDTQTLHVCEPARSIVEDEWPALAWSADHRTHNERCYDDLSDALLYILAEFVVVTPPTKVITEVTSAAAARARAMAKATRRPGI